MKKLLSLLPLLFLFAACRFYEEPENNVSPPDNFNFSEIFEAFWRGMDRNYMYWSEEPSPHWGPVLDSLDSDMRNYILKYPESFWDIIYDYYKPQFDELGVFSVSATGDQSPDFVAAAIKAYEYFAGMTLGLRDGHFNIEFNSDLRFYMPGIVPGENYLSLPQIFPHMARLNPDDFVFQDYIPADSFFGPERKVYNQYGMIFVSGRMPFPGGGDILYLSFNTCSLYNFMSGNLPPVMEELMTPAEIAGIQAVIQSFFDDLKDTSLDTRGVIIDIRGNIGGDPRDVGYLMGRMIEESVTLSYSRTKTGEGRLDYGPWTPVLIVPAPKAERLVDTNIPVVVLVSSVTNSAAEFITRAAKNMPKGFVLGTTTGGASTITSDRFGYNRSLFFGGPFWTQVSGATAQYRETDGNIYEGFGIPPDFDIPMSSAGKRDPQLDAAINLIVTGRP